MKLELAIVYILLCFCLFFAYSAPEPTWELAHDGDLQEMYYPYELCVLKLAQTGLYDNKKDIHHQDKCYHVLYEQFNGLDKRCWLGSRQQRIDVGVCVTSLQYVQCTPLVNRTSFWKRWDDLKAPSNMLGFAEHFLDTAHRRGFRGVVFAGDSMAVQYGQRLACSLLRNNVSMKMFGNYFNMASGTGVSALVDLNTVQKGSQIGRVGATLKRDMVLSLYRLPFLVGQYNIIHKGKSQMNGMDAACGNDLSNQECRIKHAHTQIYTRISNGTVVILSVIFIL